MDFKTFCEKTAKFLNLELVPMKENAKRAITYHATRSLPNPKYEVEFSDLSLSEEHQEYYAEVFGQLSGRMFLLGYIGCEKCNDEEYFEHWQCQVSPEGRYNENYMPIDENGKETDGHLWQYYYGKSLKRACNSFLKGGALTNPERKPIRVW